MNLALLCLYLFVSQAQEPALLSELNRIDRELTVIELQVTETGALLASLQKQIVQLEAELASTSVRHDEAWVFYRRRLRALARMPEGSRTVLLGGARSLGEYLEASQTLRWIAKADQQLLARYQKESAGLKELENNLVNQRQILENRENDLRIKRDQLAEKRQEKLSLAEKIVRDKGLSVRWHTERTNASTELASLVRKLVPLGRPGTSFAQSRGLLPWPAIGPVSATFGRKLEPSTQTVTAHNGIDIQARAKSSVRAVAKGTVVVADWLPGYGQVVIIDHADDYHTIYAHLSKIEVKVGDEIEQGQEIGTVGDTGSLRGTLLYFELRTRGTPQNPLEWLRR